MQYRYAFPSKIAQETIHAGSICSSERISQGLFSGPEVKQVYTEPSSCPRG